MSNLKPFIFACLAGILTAGGLLSASCSGTTAYKPSGLPERIAFTSDRDKAAHIFTIKPDGTDIQPTSSDNRTNDGVPAWSPDGTKIAFTSSQSDKYEIWTMDVDGNGRKRLTDLKSLSNMPRWSPDGKKIAFISRVMAEGGIPSIQVFVMNSDGSGLQQLTTADILPSGSEGRAVWNSVPAWSPDSTKIIFSSNRDGDGRMPVLYTMNTDGSDQKKFGLSTDVDGSQPDWSPVNNKIVWIRGSAAKLDIWVMDAGLPMPLLTAKKLTDNIDNNTNPVWSPDGKQITYVSDAGNNQDVYIMNADGSNVRRLTTDKAKDGFPAWRP